MRKILAILLLLIIITSGCDKGATTTAQVPEDNKIEIQNSNTPETAKTAEQPIEVTPGKQSKIDVPQRYIDFINGKEKLSEDRTIVSYINKDLDLDGASETMIGIGMPDDDTNPSHIYNIYVLREDNGKIEQVEGEIMNVGYSIYDIKLISLQNLPNKYIYLGLTNWGGMYGFQVIGLEDKKLKTICYSASATGAGEDTLQDFNNDGQYDGFVQDRWSYEVFYYPTKATYTLEDGEFVLRDATVEVPEYPDNIKDVITQYLSLIMISDEQAPEVMKRLAELCIDDKSKQDYFKNDTWYNAVHDTIVLLDDVIEFNIDENGDAAEAKIVYIDDEKKQHTYTFHMIKLENRWVIDKIN